MSWMAHKQSEHNLDFTSALFFVFVAIMYIIGKVLNNR